ncbi:MAG: hypothetical protein AB1454_10965 [Candidatus Auribacterota bacterium]
MKLFRTLILLCALGLTVMYVAGCTYNEHYYPGSMEEFRTQERY